MGVGFQQLKRLKPTVRAGRGVIGPIRFGTGTSCIKLKFSMLPFAAVAVTVHCLESVLSSFFDGYARCECERYCKWHQSLGERPKVSEHVRPDCKWGRGLGLMTTVDVMPL